MQFIDLAAQQLRIREKIETRIRQVLDHGQYIMGPEVEQLEEKLAAFVGVDHCISCSSGTDALLIALMALDIGPGDHLVSAPESLFDLAGVYPLKMTVVGVLSSAHSSDDLAIFVDLKTAWIFHYLPATRSRRNLW